MAISYNEDEYYVIGGSTGADVDETATDLIRSLNIREFTGLKELKHARLQVPRTECHVFLSQAHNRLVVVGGSDEPVIDAFEHEKLRYFDPNKMFTVQNNTYVQLCGFTTEIDMKSCCVA